MKLRMLAVAFAIAAVTISSSQLPPPGAWCKKCTLTCNTYAVGQLIDVPNGQRRVETTNPHNDCTYFNLGSCSTTGTDVCYTYVRRWWDWVNWTWMPWGSTVHSENTGKC